MRQAQIPIILFAVAAVASAAMAYSDIDADEEVVFFPTCASYDAQRRQWDVPIHAWVYEPEVDSRTRQVTLALFRESLGLTSSHSEHFERRAAPFLVDNERSQALQIRFAQKQFDVGESDANGHTRTVLSMPASDVPVSTDSLQSSDPWVDFDLALKPDDPRRMGGSVQFVRPRGLSVITDIDDTIKVSEVHDRARLLKNTFIEPFEPVEGMSALFRELAAREAVFHYVSSSPWQLYAPLRSMLNDAGFPRGSVHLKQFRWKDSSFFDLFAPASTTKPPILESLIRRFPERRFVLLGDAGELDPEIYGELGRRYLSNIILICIRLPCGEIDDPARFREAFQGLPRSRWTVFTEADELREIDALASYLQRDIHP